MRREAHFAVSALGFEAAFLGECVDEFPCRLKITEAGLSAAVGEITRRGIGQLKRRRLSAGPAFKDRQNIAGLNGA